MTTMFTTDDDRWKAVIERNRQAEGHFWLGVKSTGIFCRPGCPARTPLRHNVVFLDSVRTALRAGFRPCKRCRPLGASLDTDKAHLIGDACKRIIESDTAPSLEALATGAHMSPSHFQKLFTEVVGMSPARFARSTREQRLHQELPVAANVIQAGLEAGYTSNTQIYADAPAVLGMSPGTFRNRGMGEIIRYAVIDTFLGKTLIAATPRGICRLQFGDDEQPLISALESDFTNATIAAADDDFRDLIRRTVDALGTPEALRLPLDIRGTAFQAKVWRALRQIPYGETISYGDLARNIAQPTAARAVASACGSNNIAVLIPCHRVIGKNGALTGYRWGVDRKRTLLQREMDSKPD